jgi:hypothetical protein
MTDALPRPRESAIQRNILEWLSWRGVRVFRVNQQGVPLHDGRKGFRPGPTRGVSDILGLLPGGARFLAIEVKRPGGKPTPQQQAFLDWVNEGGGVGIVASSIADVEHALREHLPDNPEVSTYHGVDAA